MRTQEQIEKAIAILECKDHWNSSDWKEYYSLRDEFEKLNPLPKEPTKQEKEAAEIAKYAAMGLVYVGRNEFGGMIFETNY